MPHIPGRMAPAAVALDVNPASKFWYCTSNAMFQTRPAPWAAYVLGTSHPASGQRIQACDRDGVVYLPRLTPPAKNKSAIANYRINGNQLWHWLFSSGFRSRNRHGAGSSARAACLSIFKIASNLHFRQCIGKSFTTVCASIIISFVPHLGHTNQYL